MPEPDEYPQEWDAKIEDPHLGYGICEVEGPEGAVDRDKYRQLLEYVQTDVEDGGAPKGFLIGNGYRKLHPNAPERVKQFTEAALLGSRRQNFCLVPTTELFRAVCAVLKTQDNVLKSSIRESLFSTIGVWRLEVGQKGTK